MGVLDKVGRSMPRARGRTLVRQCGGSGGPPQNFFYFTCSEIDSNAILAKKC